jgi:hypothetical protein
LRGIFGRLRKSAGGKGWGRKALIGAGVAGLAYILYRTQKPSPKISLKPAPVAAGEEVSADRYRQIAKRRTGMTYAPVEGTLGGTIKFSSPKTGVFTRNVVKEGDALWAEVKG